MVLVHKWNAGQLVLKRNGHDLIMKQYFRTSLWDQSRPSTGFPARVLARTAPTAQVSKPAAPSSRDRPSSCRPQGTGCTKDSSWAQCLGPSLMALMGSYEANQILQRWIIGSSKVNGSFSTAMTKQYFPLSYCTVSIYNLWCRWICRCVVFTAFPFRNCCLAIPHLPSNWSPEFFRRIHQLIIW